MSNTAALRLLDQLASEQAGAFSVRQAHQKGVSRAARNRRVASGEWVKASNRVLTAAAAPPSFLQDAWVGVLDAGMRSVVTSKAAARLLGWPEFRASDDVTLVVPHGVSVDDPVATVRQTRRPPTPIHLPETGRLPIAPPARVVCDLSAEHGVAASRLLIASVVHDGRVALHAIQRCYTELAAPNRPGMWQLGQVLGELDADGDVPTSELNRVLRAVLDPVPGPPARFEAAVPGFDADEFRCDALLDPEGIVVEADGRRWHTRMRDFARDRERDRAAARAGLVAVRFTYRELTRAPDAVVDELTELRALRRAQLHLEPAA